MAIKYNTVLQIELEPEGKFPVIDYGIDLIETSCQLEDKTILTFDRDLTVGEHKFILNFQNKTNETPDYAVKINAVIAEGICTDRLKWQGKYYPNYPEPWASQQTHKLETVINSATYLGWNGKWELVFTVPIFTWIHRIENLGWIYD